MSLTARILVGLVLGLVSGIVISLSSSDTLNSIPLFIEPVGALWVNAIRMTVVPLIVSLLITAIAGDKENGSVANLGTKTVGLFALMVGAICVYTALAAPPLAGLASVRSRDRRCFESAKRNGGYNVRGAAAFS